MDKLSGRRPRKSAPKSRSGCLTCKARHIRCDQQRPECENCTSSNRKCQGYPTPLTNTASSAQNSSHDSNTISSYSIPFKVPGSQADRQLLHYYCCQAAWNLSSYADPTLWTELILQRSQDQAVIRSSLVVLSSLHKDFVSGSLVASGKDKPSSNVETMTMVSKCYGQLKNYLARSDALPDVALVCSVLFYSLESLLGDTRQAISHLDSGLRLLKRTQTEAKWATDPLYVPLTHLFERLDVQVSCYDDLRLPVLDLVSPEETRGALSVVPDSFSTLDHAERVLVKLQNWTLRQLISHVQHKGKSSEEFPPGLWHERVVLRQQYEKYRQTLRSLDPKPGNSPLRGPETGSQENRRQFQLQQFLLLQISFHTFYNLIEENVPIAADAAAGIPVNGEDTLSTALSEVLDLLSLASNSASHSASALFPLASPSQRTYTLSTFLVGTIYFLCLKTNSQEILTTAYRLFSHPLLKNSRDGLWDSSLAEMVVKNVIKIRDRDLGIGVPDIVVTETSRESVMSSFDIEDIGWGEETDYLSADLSPLITGESDLVADAAAFFSADDSFLLPADIVTGATSVSASGTNSPYLSEGSTPRNTSESSLQGTNHQRTESLTQQRGYACSHVVLAAESHPRLEHTPAQSVGGKMATSTLGQYVEIRPKPLPSSQIQRNHIAEQFTLPPGGVPQSGRLEDFALGIVDADGGVEEAAKRISVMSI
ncbi:Fungal Zn2-Cys6 binuclear cluster domain-containing protein [Cladophialophora immunda]|nr:Fungal Zn2-Cys6 binuclear cluster domain-containing protein [Cladophialophora immunda]